MYFLNTSLLEKAFIKQREQNEKYNIELLRKEEEICLREEKLKFNENNLKTQIKKNVSNNSPTSMIINTQNIEQRKQNENVKKINDYTYIIENKKANIDSLDQQINQKKIELDALTSQIEETKQTMSIRLSELNSRLENVNKREKEINLLKQDLEAKLSEVEQKLNETHKLTNDLKINESIIIKKYQ